MITWIITAVTLGLLAIHLVSDIYLGYFTKEKRLKRKMTKRQQDLDDIFKKVKEVTGVDLKDLGVNVGNTTKQQVNQIKADVKKLDDPSVWKPQI